MEYQIAVLAGDGIGPEVVREGLKVLRALASEHGFGLRLTDYPFGAEHYLRTKELFPDAALEEIRGHDAVLLGAIGDPRFEVGLLERAIVMGLRGGLDLYVNLRPVVLYAEHLTPLKDRKPGDIDFIVRKVGEFDRDNRGGIEQTLHRISAIRNRHNDVVGLTCRVGRALYGKIEIIEDRLAKITGQKAAPRAAKISIASFKVREGDTVGLQVTLRGARMYDFLDKLIHIALPRTRDFRGLKATAIDDMGNMTVGIKENTIFPETSDEDLKDVFGLAITIVTTAKSKPEAEAFFRHIGMPLIVEAAKK